MIDYGNISSVSLAKAFCMSMGCAWSYKDKYYIQDTAKRKLYVFEKEPQTDNDGQLIRQDGKEFEYTDCICDHSGEVVKCTFTFANTRQQVILFQDILIINNE